MRFRNSNQNGGTIFIVLVVAGVIAITLGAYLSWTRTQNVLSKRSEFWNAALPAAEAGVEEALMHLNTSPNARTANGWTFVSDSYRKERTLPDNSRYVVQISTNSNPVITSSGFVRVPIQSNYVSRTVQVTCRRNSVRPGGLSTQGAITFSGSSRVDSFNSADPNASNAGAYDITKSTDHVKVTSNSSAVPAIKVGTGQVYGTVATGPGGTATYGSSGSIGDMAWHNGGNLGFQPGSVASDASMSFASVDPPSTAGAYVSLPPGGTVGGVAYTTVFTSGTYDLALLKVSSSPGVVITGDVTIYTHGEFTISGSGLVRIAPGARLTIYVGGKMTVSGSGVLNDTQLAENCMVYGLPTCTTATVSGSGAFIGSVYAPQAAMTISGGGGFVGSAAADNVTISGGAAFHYDEALGGNQRPYVPESWNEI
jgi:hypothetical protein